MAPNIIAVGDLVREITENGHKIPPGMMWLPKRPQHSRWRVYAAWLVFTGKADALEWK